MSTLFYDFMPKKWDFLPFYRGEAPFFELIIAFTEGFGAEKAVIGR